MGRRLGGRHADRQRADGADQAQQLGLRNGPAARPRRPARLPAARAGARRLLGDQRHDLHPRPSRRLRPLGGARQSRLVLCRDPALLPQGGEQRDHSRRLSRPRRPAERRRSALRQSVPATLPRRGARGAVAAQRRFQRRAPGRARPLSGHPDQRRALQRRARLSAAASGQAAQSQRRDARPRAAAAVRRQARGRRRNPPARRQANRAGAARDHRRARRLRFAATADAVGRRRGGGAGRGGNRAADRLAGRRRQSARPPRRRARLRLALARLGRPVVRRAHAARSRRSRAIAASGAAWRRPISPRRAASSRRGPNSPSPTSSSISSLRWSKATRASCAGAAA